MRLSPSGDRRGVTRWLQARCALIATIALLVVGCAGAAAPGPATPATRRAPPAELVAGAHLHGWLINGDTEARHEHNIDAAARALRARGATDAHLHLSESRRGNAGARHLAEMAKALAAELGPDDQLVVYFTGHGAPEGLVLQGGEILGREDLLRLLQPLHDRSTIFVFDSCFAGDLPGLLSDKGFHAVAMAPVAEGEESQCQLFAPAFWAGVEIGVEAQGAPTVSLRDVFRSAMAAYNTGRGRLGLPAITGTHVAPLPEARALGDILTGCTLVELTATWCKPCQAQQRELSFLDLYRDDGVRVFTVDVDRGPLHHDLQRILGGEVSTLPEVVLFKDGRRVEVMVGLQRAAKLRSRVEVGCGIELGVSSRARASIARELAAGPVGTRVAAMEILLRMGVIDEDLVRAFQALVMEVKPAELASVVDRLASARALGDLVAKLDPSATERLGRALSFEQSLKLAMLRLGADAPVARVGGVRAVSDLMAMADDESKGNIRPAMLPLLDAVLDDHREVRRAAAAALGRALARLEIRAGYWTWARSVGGEWDKARDLGELLRDADASVRAGAAVTAGLAARDGQDDKLAELLLSDRSGAVRRSAAQGLALLPRRQSELRLLRALDDRDPGVVESAVEAIVWRAIGRGQDKLALHRALAHPRRRAAIAAALGRLLRMGPKVTDPELFPLVIELLDGRHRGANIALMHLSDERLLPALLTRARSPDPKSRAKALTVLATLPDPIAAQMLEDTRTDSDAEVRELASEGLVRRAELLKRMQEAEGRPSPWPAAPPP